MNLKTEKDLKQSYLKRSEIALKFLLSDKCVISNAISVRVLDCDIETDSVTLEFDLNKSLGNLMNTVHGGIIAWIADVSIAIAVSFSVGEFHGSTVDLSVNYIGPVQTNGVLIVKAYNKRVGSYLRRGVADFFVNDNLVATAVANYTGKEMNCGYFATVVDDYTWVVKDFGSRIFVLVGDQQAAFIDTGISGIIKAMQFAYSDMPEIVINTNAGKDHIGGNKLFEKLYLNEKELDTYKNNGGIGSPLPLSDGDIIDLGNRPLKIIELPALSAGNVAVLDINNRTLYAGDIVSDSKDYLISKNMNSKMLAECYEKLLGIQDDFDTIVCSHGSVSVNKDILNELIDFIKS